MKKNRIRWGIVGCGNVTEKKSGPAFNKVPGSSLVAVMRRDLNQAKDYARRHRVTHAFGEADALINHPDVDAVYIATPPGSHAELALRVAAAGKPCYVEKPMARNTSECHAMVEAFRAAGQPLFVAYYRRALPQFRQIQALIQSGRLGHLRQLHHSFANGAQLTSPGSGDWRYNPESSGGGLLWDLGSHALDLFDFWTGPLLHPSGHAINVTGRGEVEELAAISAHTAGGVSISATWNFISSTAQDAVTLVFDEGRIECSVFGPPNIVLIDADGRRKEATFELPENIQLNLIGNVVDVLLNDASPWSTGDSALRTNAVLDSTVRSHRNPCGL